MALPKFRKSLLYLGLLEEQEFVEEEHRSHIGEGTNIHESHGVSTSNFDVGLKAIKLELGKYLFLIIIMIRIRIIYL